METIEVVTIDGPAGAGKSTVARALAERLEFSFLDTGAMYRAVTWKAIQEGVDADDDAALESMVTALELEFVDDNHLIVNDHDVTELIRAGDVTARVSAYAANPVVRRAMSAAQRALGARGGLVCEGRDMGTHVFPDAAVRFYLDASPEVRGKRRYDEMASHGDGPSLEEIVADIERRDEADSKREAAPLKRIDEQIYLDSSDLSRDEVIDVLEREARERLARFR